VTQDKNDTGEETLSVKDMRSVLKEETRAVMRAADLRIRELTQLTTAYATGELTPSEATEQYMHYMDKWGDALPGIVKNISKLTDEEIVAEMEKTFGRHTARVQATKQSQKGSGRSGSE
jgi:hypothetical protein